jgi:arylsulfatase A-like enzyme
MPTLCEIAGVETEQDIDGRSLADVLLRNGKGDPDRQMIWVRREGNHRYQGRAYYAIRRGDWKLQQSTPFAPMVLVNLSEDPREQSPLPAQGDKAKELARELMNHLQRAGAIPWAKR